VKLIVIKLGRHLFMRRSGRELRTILDEARPFEIRHGTRPGAPALLD
jgi:hypothetical protein